ncbi:MAG TPA: Xaa-Pro peptidase family protein [Mycobacteriales bacterium]|nr:Xaa-Pro peptidase family protein [Mycobacteriales bacterium]
MARRTGLAKAFGESAGACLVTNPVNLRYLTGFTGSNGAALVRPDGSAVLATDGRYAEQAAGESPDVEILVTRDVAVDLVRRAVADGVSTLAIERRHVTLTTADRFTEAAGDVEFVDLADAIEKLRIAKDDAELQALRRACAVTDEVFTAVLERLNPGVTERDISWALSEEMNLRGASPAFPSIVAFGSNSARPHHQPSDRTLERGDLVKLDFGALVEGYHADMTRTVVAGVAADWQRDLHELVRKTQEEARAQVRPGALPADLDAHARGLIQDSGHEVAHGLGHGVGLEIHEAPFLVDKSPADTLVERVPVTVEPGIYLPGRGGVRIEDTVVVTADGAESLTRSPRELLVI